MPLFDRFKVILSGGRLDVSKRFTLLDEAISGTMSKFYMGRDMQTNEVVGLKILDPVKSAAFGSRFKGLHKPSEGEIAVQLKHPHIVKTLQYGLTTEGAQYLVMEHLAGPNMDAALATRAFCLAGTASVSSARLPRRLASEAPMDDRHPGPCRPGFRMDLASPWE